MPDVDLARREGVELIRTGSWGASTGSWNPTREDILAAVKAMECSAVRRPRLKLGHTDTRFNGGGDGEPALGWFENLRTSDGGHTLVADQVALPWLNAVQAAAYPDRSIEGNYHHRCSLGHDHKFVVTAVALLGVTPPAVDTLRSVQDLPAMLGVAAAQEVPDGAEHVQVTVRAEEPQVKVPNVLMPVRAAGDEKLRAYWVRGAGAKKIRWSEPGDFDRCVKELRRYVADPKGLCAEYHHEALGVWPGREHVNAASGKDTGMSTRAQQIRDAWNASNPPHSQWVQEARADAAIVVDDIDRTYRLYPVSWDGETPVFGEPQSYDPAADKVLVYASRADSRPDGQPADPPQDPGPLPDANPSAPPEVPAPVLPAAEPEPENTDPKEDHVSTDLSAVRSRLGLDDTADEQAILVALDALKSKADTPAEPTPEMVAASAAVEAEKSELRKEVQVLASQLQQVTAEVAAAKADKAATVKASVFDAAIKDGKIKPADRETWEKDYDEAPAAVTRVLASIAAGTAVPVMASGSTGSPEPVEGGFDEDEFTKMMFGPGYQLETKEA